MKQNFLQTLSLWKKHKVLSVLLGLVILCLAVFLAWYFQPIPTRTVTGQINGRSFSMEVPKDWETNRNIDGNLRVVKPLSSGETQVSSAVWVQLWNPEEYADFHAAQSLMAGDSEPFVSYHKNTDTEFQLDSHRSVSYHGLAMTQLSYSQRKYPEADRGYFSGYWMEHEGSILEISAFRREGELFPFQRVAKKAAQSFQWK